MYPYYNKSANSSAPSVQDFKKGDVNGDGFIDLVYLMGENPSNESPFIKNITIVIKDPKTGLFYSIPLQENAGYNPTLFLGDFTGNHVMDILVRIDSGGSGGFGYYYIYSFLNNIPKKLFDYQEYNDYYRYTVNYEDNYKVKIENTILDIQFIIDISTKGPDYLSELYNPDGTLKKPTQGYVMPLSGVYPVDYNRDGVYELNALQRVTGLYNADELGILQSVLYWNGYKFVPFDDNQYMAVIGTSSPCLPETNLGIDFSRVKCVFSEGNPNKALEKAIIKAYNLKPSDTGNTYYYNDFDLNDSGEKETIVYLMGPSFCGTGGCSAAIFREVNNSYELLSKFTLVNNPIIFSDTKTNGFRDIILYVSGNGDGYYAILKHNGRNYPSNPSLAPKVPMNAQVRGTAVVSDKPEDFKGIELIVP